MLWHRWNDTETIDTPNYTKRPYLYELPVLRQDISDYMHYPTKDELVVSLILSDMGAYFRRIAETYDTSFQDPYPEYHELLAKRLPWFVKHLLERTDMTECGVALRAFITNDIRDTAMSYLEACHFPMDCVVWIENTDSQYRWSSKYDAIRHPALHFAERVIHFDLSFLIGTHPAQRRSPLFRDFLDSWGDEHIASASATLTYNRDEHSAVSMPRVEEITTNFAKPREHPIWEAISRCYGNSISSIIDYWTQCDPFVHIAGGVIGYSQTFLRDSYMQKRFDTLLGEANNDEVVLGLIAHYESEWLKVANIHDAFRWCGYPYERFPYDVVRICTCEERMPSELFLGMHTQ